MLTNTQPIIDSILASEPVRFISPAVQAQLKQALIDDLGVSSGDADSMLSTLIPILESLPRNTALPLLPTPTFPPTTAPPPTTTAPPVPTTTAPPVPTTTAPAPPTTTGPPV